MPTLTEALRQDPRLLDYLKTTCAERGMSITLDPRLRPADVVVLAPDVYYNTERPNPPGQFEVADAGRRSRKAARWAGRRRW